MTWQKERLIEAMHLDFEAAMTQREIKYWSTFLKNLLSLMNELIRFIRKKNITDSFSSQFIFFLFYLGRSQIISNRR